MTATEERYEASALALPTFIFLQLARKCGHSLHLTCWQTDAHSFWLKKHTPRRETHLE